MRAVMNLMLNCGPLPGECTGSFQVIDGKADAVTECDRRSGRQGGGTGRRGGSKRWKIPFQRRLETADESNENSDRTYVGSRAAPGAAGIQPAVTL